MSAIKDRLQDLRLSGEARNKDAVNSNSQGGHVKKFPLVPEDQQGPKGKELLSTTDLNRKDEHLPRMHSTAINISENAVITAENAETMARTRRQPYNDLDTFYEQIQHQQGKGHSIRLDDVIRADEKKRLHDQWLQTVDIGAGWKGRNVLGRGGNGIAGRFDWLGVGHNEDTDRSWELAVKSICVKQSRALGPTRGLNIEGDFMKILNSTGSKHFPKRYNFVKRTRGRNVEGLHIDHAEREVNQLIMEYCPGGSLADLVDILRKKNEGLPEFAVWSIFICLAKALQVMKEGTEEQAEEFELIDASDVGDSPKSKKAAITPPKNIDTASKQQTPIWKPKIHFDLKPDNIFIGTKWVTSGLSFHSHVPIHKVGDLGMMHNEEDFKKSENQKRYLGWGTPSFIPPEQHKSTFREVNRWLYTTRMNIYQVGTIIWCIMLRQPGHFAIEEAFSHRTFKRQNGAKTIKTRGGGLKHGQRPTLVRAKEGGLRWTGPLEPVAKYDYSNHLKDLVQECLALNHEDRPSEDELLQRTLGSFGMAYNAYIFKHAKLSVGQIQGVWDRLVVAEPSPSQPDTSRGNPGGGHARPKMNQPNTPPRMHLDTPPDYWVADAPESLKLFHEKKRKYWEKRNAQIVAARKYIRHHRNVVQDFKGYTRELARNRDVEKNIGCNDEDISEKEDQEEYLTDSGNSWVDWDALPTSSGPRMVMGLDGKLTKRQWYFPGEKKERELNAQQIKEIEAKKLAEIRAEQKKKYDPLLPHGPTKPPSPQPSQHQQGTNQQEAVVNEPQKQRGSNWGGASHAAAARQNLPTPPRVRTRPGSL